MTGDGRPGQEDRAVIEFRQFYSTKYDDLLGYVRHKWPHVDATSIVDETLKRVWQYRDKISGEWIAYAKATAKNLVMDEYRKPRELLLEPAEIHLRLISAEIPVDSDDPDDAMVRRVENALNRLPAHLETAMRMKLNEFDNERIAREMDCTVTSVSQYLSRARGLMAKDLGTPVHRRQRGAREDPGAMKPKPRHDQDEED
ncbi:RNA polymerase sigma factor [Nocardia sp. NRRL S-836]|uniref:RNA polymerase sigma factor n=1 Tax=Nocardia sp. NRRL S-836 TaxID=1519492 RepID=UPI0006AED1EA|nr:sigma-70 family RNA polymerase sigma factor [Nocardia sp. NRRL S-836]KOV84118.1 hypothetical protein ADL03_17860 [Nocardia sp. NRRL S-836]